jgi:hypothetical protein
MFARLSLSMKARLLGSAAVLGVLSLGLATSVNAHTIVFNELSGEILDSIVVDGVLQASPTVPVNLGAVGNLLTLCDAAGGGCNISPVNGDGDQIVLRSNGDGTSSVVGGIGVVISGFNDGIAGLGLEPLTITAGTDLTPGGNTFSTFSRDETGTIPGPATISLVGLGLLALAAARRFRRQRLGTEGLSAVLPR